MTEAVITTVARTAVGKAQKGTLRATRPDDMAATVLLALENEENQNQAPAQNQKTAWPGPCRD